VAYCRQCNKLLQAMQHARRGGDTGKRGNARFNAHTHQCPYTHAHARTRTDAHLQEQKLAERRNGGGRRGAPAKPSGLSCPRLHYRLLALCPAAY